MNLKNLFIFNNFKKIITAQKIMEEKINNINLLLNQQRIINMYNDRGFKLPLEVCWTKEPDIIKVQLNDIHWKSWIDGKIYSLKETIPYRYLITGNKSIYLDYLNRGEHLRFAKEWWSLDRFNDLVKKIKIEGYSTSNGIITLDKDNCLLDGQHRCCILLYLYGDDFEILVAKRD